MRPSAILPILCIGALAACGDGRPDVAVVTLAPAKDTLHLPYPVITHAVPLGPQRWAVLAANEELVALIDIARQDVDTLGGAGHPAYRNPLALFGWDTLLYVSDWGLRRVTAWDHNGRLADSLPAIDALRGALPAASDALGRLYVELPPHSGRDGRGNLDSAAVVRVDADGQTIDTIARLAPLDMVQVEGEHGPRFERRVLSGEDAWGVRPDGAVWIARVGQNRVTWYEPAGDGRPRRGALLPDRLLPVTEADRDAFLNQFPRAMRSVALKLPFAAIKPPFVAGFTADDGRVWLERSRAAADADRQYHIIDSTGALAQVVHLPGWARILAVAEGTALAFETTERGGRVMRYRIEGAPPASRP